MTRVLSAGVRGKTDAPLAELLAARAGSCRSSPTRASSATRSPPGNCRSPAAGRAWPGSTPATSPRWPNALLEQGHTGQIHELSGPEALTLPHTAELMSAALGRPVAHVELTIEESVAGMRGFERELTTTTLERLHAGVFAEVTDTVERVAGRPSRTLQSFLAHS